MQNTTEDMETSWLYKMKLISSQLKCEDPSHVNSWLSQGTARSLPLPDHLAAACSLERLYKRGTSKALLIRTKSKIDQSLWFVGPFFLNHSHKGMD